LATIEANYSRTIAIQATLPLKLIIKAVEKQVASHVPSKFFPSRNRSNLPEQTESDDKGVKDIKVSV
jgi:hypothetical protein